METSYVPFKNFGGAGLFQICPGEDGGSIAVVPHILVVTAVTFKTASLNYKSCG